MSQPFNASVKGLIDAAPAAFVALLGGPAGVPAAVIDSDTAVKAGAADRVIRVGTVPPWLLHLEIQAAFDPAKPRRMHFYNTVLDEKHGLAIESVLVLLTRQADNPAVYTGRWTRPGPRPGTGVQFNYEVVPLWQWPAERFLAGGPALIPLAPLADVRASAMPRLVRQIDAGLAGEPEADRREWLSTAFTMMGLRFGRATVERARMEVSTMMRESVFVQMMIEEGEAIGARRLLIGHGTKRFGPPDADTLAALNAITDIETLEELNNRLADVVGWADLLPTPA